MREIVVPRRVEEYKEDLFERAFPEPLITDEPFYQKMIGWTIDNRTPLLYEQDHPDEYVNLSINFNWLLLRDYSKTTLGPQDTILAMYALHEFRHMNHWLPTRLDELSPAEYAEQFTGSEYGASNETELFIHWRIPELRGLVFPGMKIAFDVLKERWPQKPDSTKLLNLRRVFVEDDILDDIIFPDDPEIAQRFRKYGGNRAWAAERFSAIAPHFSDPSLPLGTGLTTHEHDAFIEAYQPGLSQEQYEANIMRNVRFGYAMCGLALPKFKDFKSAVAAAKDLEGQHAIVQS